jgi:hypothetical protein
MLMSQATAIVKLRCPAKMMSSAPSAQNRAPLLLAQRKAQFVADQALFLLDAPLPVRKARLQHPVKYPEHNAAVRRH